MFDLGNAATLARELKGRYDPLRAVTLTARLMQKAMFAGRSDDVVFWALVYAFYRGHGLNALTSEQLDAFRAELLTSLKQPTSSLETDTTPAVKRRSTRR
ncbi:hypothetical protein [uncultured Enterovirga sp.]|uniref:hypothetical protein n=1 Tax=uncultured Enterovirga sp. TaxID=2026352 RepID=UPI0035C992DB